MALRFDERGTHQQGSGLSSTLIIVQNSSKSYRNSVGLFLLYFLMIFTALLGNVIGIKEDSRIGVIQALWNYIKIQGLQDKMDRRMIRADDQLRPVRSFFSLTFLLPYLFIKNRYSTLIHYHSKNSLKP
jgi:hypothetical protein